MKITDAMLATGWHTTNSRPLVPGMQLIDLFGTEGTYQLYFKQNEPGFFRVFGQNLSGAWKTSMTFLQIKTMVSDTVNFEKIKDQSIIRATEEEYKKAKFIDIPLTMEEKDILKSLIAFMDENDKISKDNLSITFDKMLGSRDAGRTKATQMLLAGVLDFDEETEQWEIMIPIDKILDLPDNAEEPNGNV